MNSSNRPKTSNGLQGDLLSGEWLSKPPKLGNGKHIRFKPLCDVAQLAVPGEALQQRIRRLEQRVDDAERKIENLNHANGRQRRDPRKSTTARDRVKSGPRTSLKISSTPARLAEGLWQGARRPRRRN